ncbi:zinc finger protein 1 homolog [Rhipicephalus sanguineus]|uniref:zinc finger protein 1 homolog n=1 Tax=Rhipicephalus sanguineus TaxID=34632 RepID=UPI0020C5AA9D|nr:zinc finger protein 1 homolog [Rhipicephalus sanguineus]
MFKWHALFFCAEEWHSSFPTTLEYGKSESHCSSIAVSETERLSDMEVHHKIHTGKRLFECHLCPQRFKRNSNLKQHLRTHTEERHSSCPATLEDGKSQQRQSHCSSIGVCKTERPSDVEVHHKVHIVKRLFECHLCPQSFQQKGNLNQHLRTHTGERPHQCPSCDKSFSARCKLRDHLRTHTETHSSPAV